MNGEQIKRKALLEVVCCTIYRDFKHQSLQYNKEAKSQQRDVFCAIPRICMIRDDLITISLIHGLSLGPLTRYARSEALNDYVASLEL